MSASISDPFAILGLPVRFGLMKAEIEARWKELSRVLHPDRHVHGTPEERRLALSRAVAVNEAYRVLRDDLSRADAVLRLRGLTAPVGADQALLMDVMERREALAESRQRGDDAAVARLATTVRAEAEEAKRALSEALDGADADASRAPVLLSRLRYLRRFLDEVQATEAVA